MKNVQVIQTGNTKTINVNDLNRMLQKHFRCAETFIESIETADFKNQYRPLKYVIGANGMLNITFSSSRKLS